MSTECLHPSEIDADDKSRNFELEAGQRLDRSPNQPVLQIVGEGQGCYLWIGNNAPGDHACFATLGDRMRLKKLARRILKAIEED